MSTPAGVVRGKDQGLDPQKDFKNQIRPCLKIETVLESQACQGWSDEDGSTCSAATITCMGAGRQKNHLLGWGTREIGS